MRWCVGFRFQSVPAVSPLFLHTFAVIIAAALGLMLAGTGAIGLQGGAAARPLIRLPSRVLGRRHALLAWGLGQPPQLSR
jgi:hypothetical protein